MVIPIISLVTFTLMLVLTSVSFIQRRNSRLLIGYCLVYAVFLLFIFIQNIFDFYIHDIVLLFCVITAFGHFFIGENLRIYYMTKYYDRGLHLFGTFSYTLLFHLIILYTIRPPLTSNAFIFIYVVSLGTFLGVIFELIEFAIDSIYKSNNQSGLVDTNFDLIFDILGSILAAILVICFKGIYF